MPVHLKSVTAIQRARDTTRACKTEAEPNRKVRKNADVSEEIRKCEMKSDRPDRDNTVPDLGFGRDLLIEELPDWYIGPSLYVRIELLDNQMIVVQASAANFFQRLAGPDHQECYLHRHATNPISDIHDIPLDAQLTSSRQCIS